MNFLLIVLGAFLGCLIENIMLGVVNYFVKLYYAKKVGQKYGKR